jgi:predicted nucleotidyltransferase
MSIEQLIKEKRAEILEITSLHGATKVRIFGSAARGTSKPGSDIDLLIQLQAGRSLLDIVAIKQDLEDLLDCKVDVVTEAALSPYIKDDVLQQAVSL